MIVPAGESSDLYIAIYRTSSIGDVVLASALLDAFERLPIRIRLYWLGRRPSLELLSQCFPMITTIEVKATDTASSVQRFRDTLTRADLVVDLQKNIRSRMICFEISRTLRATLYRPHKMQIERSMLVLKSYLRGRTRSASPAIKTPAILQYEMMLNSLDRALRPFEIKLPLNWRDVVLQARPRLPIEHLESNQSWNKELAFGKWLAIAPGAAHLTKKTPLEIWRSILIKFRDYCSQNRLAVGLLFLGDQNDRQDALDLISELNWPFATLNLAGKLSLTECAQALAKTELALSNDSSLAHIAEAVGVSTGVMFGPTVETFGFAPQLKSSRAFSSLLGCRPCSKHGKVVCRYGDKLCFSSISVAEVFAFLREHFHEEA